MILIEGSHSSRALHTAHVYWFQDLSLLSLSCGTCNVQLALLCTNYRDTRCGCSFLSSSCCDCDCYGNSDGNAHIPWLNQKPSATTTAPPAPAPSFRHLFAFSGVCVVFLLFSPSCSCYVMMAGFHFCYTRCQTIATYCCTCFSYLSIHTVHRFPFPFSIAFLVFCVLVSKCLLTAAKWNSIAWKMKYWRNLENLTTCCSG